MSHHTFLPYSNPAQNEKLSSSLMENGVGMIDDLKQKNASNRKGSREEGKRFKRKEKEEVKESEREHYVSIKKNLYQSNKIVDENSVVSM